MTKIAAIGLGVALAGFLTHAALYGGRHLSDRNSPWSYAGASQRVLLGINARWSRAHGLPGEADCRIAMDHAGAGGGVIAVSYVGTHEDTAGTVCSWSPSHIDGFLRFLMLALRVTCPTLGFAFFLLLGRKRPGLQLWQPLTILIVALGLPVWGFWAEIARNCLVTLGMIGAVALFADTERRENAV